MGRTEINIKLKTDYTKGDLDRIVRRETGLKEFRWEIIKKSLDSRRKDRIHWQIRLRVESPSLPDDRSADTPALEIPRIRSSRKVLIAGSGPAGIFSALYLQKAGLQTILLERGPEVRVRQRDIQEFERQGSPSGRGNYSFGEGGAGTFSDGKLTSRSKHIKKERRYILSEFVRHGAPEEILYLAHPHIGSDNLIPVAENMRRSLLEAGGEILFDSTLEDLIIKDGRLRAVRVGGEEREADYFILATGHSALDSLRMYIRRGIPYRAKNFALGFRMEHPQELINRIQWGVPALPGVKAAEYRLTSGAAELPVYSFCMCPGGKIVPAAPFPGRNIVNGMSLYRRDGEFANAAIVAGISPGLIGNEDENALYSLDWLEKLEERFYREAGDSYRAPAMRIADFIGGRSPGELLPTSYPLPLIPADLGSLLPAPVTGALREGLGDLCRRLPGWDRGQLLGLESKTSSPVQVLRDRTSGLTEGLDNLFICGEASGWSGGIISSASDGLKAALSIADSLI
jgi:uncharacterized FAD-dependent dehydrogenase